MTSKSTHLITTLIKNINEFPLDDLDPLFDELISLISLDHSLFQTDEERAAFNQLLLTIIGVLKQDDEDESSLEFSKIIELLDVMIPVLSYEDAIKVISFDTLLQALGSKLPELEVLAVKIFSKASPPDILANTEVINKYVHLLTEDRSVRVASEIEKSFDLLLRGKLILRRLLSEENMELIDSAIVRNDQLIMSRLLCLTLLILEHSSREDIDLHVIPLVAKLTPDVTNLDEIYMLNLIQFYVDILSLIDGSVDDKFWLLQTIKPFINSLIQLYKSDEKFAFIEGSITELYAKVSYLSPEYFEELDNEYIHMKTKPTALLLSSINPKYLSCHHAPLLSKLRITFNAIPAYRNLIPEPQSFLLIKPSITSKDIVRQAYLEFIAITESLSRHEPTFLLSDLPQVMNKLLMGEAVTEQECYELRKRTLDNLQKLDDSKLDIWKDSVRYEWSVLVNGKGRNPEVAVFDSSM